MSQPEIVWQDPPPERQPNMRCNMVAQRLRQHPGAWAMVGTHNGGIEFLPWWGPLNISPDFEVRLTRTGGALSPGEIYIRYTGETNDQK